jgi:hypothetical protein
MSDPNSHRTPTEGPGEQRPIRRGFNWGAVIGWIFALAVIAYVVGIVLGNNDRGENRSVLPSAPALTLHVTTADAG